MSDALKTILEGKRALVDRLKAEKSFAAMDAEAKAAPQVRGFATALRSKISGGDVALITEIKKASPSAGVIRADFAPAALARAYEAGGAACLSVLTDEPSFQGCNQDLIDARAACTLPVLRKDFMIDVWQVAESRGLGADCILIIMAAVSDVRASELHEAATGYGMDVLIESHDRIELERALRLPSGIIGINNRNLKTLKTNLQTTEDMLPFLPPDRLVVSESGLSTANDLARLQALGVGCFLVGESLLKQKDVTTATLELRLN